MIGRFDLLARRLAEAFWPGALTLVVPRADDCPVSDLATAGLDTVAVRVPDHDVAHRLLTAVGRPVVAPSANRSGHVSPTRADDVLADLAGRIDAVIDGGVTRVGVESTIVRVDGGVATILRPGGVTREAIEAVLGATVGNAIAGRCLGRRRRSPARAGHARLALRSGRGSPSRCHQRGARRGAAGVRTRPCARQRVGGRRRDAESAPATSSEAASRLFRCLRDLDRPDVTTIAVAPIPAIGLGEAIRDRLARAAAAR
jgi:L-threonylcarbamoyladenylate synthase